MTQSLFKAEIAFSLFKEVETRVEFSISFSGRVDLATDKKKKKKWLLTPTAVFEKLSLLGCLEKRRLLLLRQKKLILDSRSSSQFVRSCLKLDLASCVLPPSWVKLLLLRRRQFRHTFE